MSLEQLILSRYTAEQLARALADDSDAMAEPWPVRVRLPFERRARWVVVDCRRLPSAGQPAVVEPADVAFAHAFMAVHNWRESQRQSLPWWRRWARDIHVALWRRACRDAAAGSSAQADTQRSVPRPAANTTTEETRDAA